MFHSIILLFLLVLLPGNPTVYSSAGAEEGSLHIKINNLKPKKGDIKVAIHNIETTFPDKEGAYILKKFPMVDKESTMVAFDNLPFGEYAIAVYQDENLNDKLDKNLIGIPKEPWGLSNNPAPGMSAPKFHEALFILDQASHEIVVNLR